MIHFPIQITAVTVSDHMGMGRDIYYHPAMFLAFLIASFTLAALSYIGFEYPMQQWLRSRMSERKAVPTQAEVMADAREYAAVESGAVAADDFAPVAEIVAKRDAVEDSRFNRECQMKEVRKRLATGETGLIEWAADEMICREGFTIEKGSPADLR